MKDARAKAAFLFLAGAVAVTCFYCLQPTTPIAPAAPPAGALREPESETIPPPGASDVSVRSAVPVTEESPDQEQANPQSAPAVPNSDRGIASQQKLIEYLFTKEGRATIRDATDTREVLADPGVNPRRLSLTADQQREFEAVARDWDRRVEDALFLQETNAAQARIDAVLKGDYTRAPSGRELLKMADLQKQYGQEVSIAGVPGKLANERRRIILTPTNSPLFWNARREYLRLRAARADAFRAFLSGL